MFHELHLFYKSHKLHESSINNLFLFRVELKPFRDFVPSCGETSLYRAMNIKNLRRKLDYLEKRVQILEEEYKY